MVKAILASVLAPAIAMLSGAQAEGRSRHKKSKSHRKARPHRSVARTEVGPRFVILPRQVSESVISEIFPVSEAEMHMYGESEQDRKNTDMEPMVASMVSQMRADREVHQNLSIRCSTGTKRTTMIDEERDLYPERGFVRIGRGGDRCVVTYASFETRWCGCVPRSTRAFPKSSFSLIMGVERDVVDIKQTTHVFRKNNGGTDRTYSSRYVHLTTQQGAFAKCSS